MWNKNVTEVYSIEEKEDDDFIGYSYHKLPIRQAEIIFNDDIFTKCKYQTESKEYSYDDWCFLKQVAEKIIAITDEKRKGGENNAKK